MWPSESIHTVAGGGGVCRTWGRTVSRSPRKASSERKASSDVCRMKKQSRDQAPGNQPGLGIDLKHSMLHCHLLSFPTDCVTQLSLMEGRVREIPMLDTGRGKRIYLCDMYMISLYHRGLHFKKLKGAVASLGHWGLGWLSRKDERVPGAWVRMGRLRVPTPLSPTGSAIALTVVCKGRKTWMSAQCGKRDQLGGLVTQCQIWLSHHSEINSVWGTA